MSHNSKDQRGWCKRSALFCALAMLIGAGVAMDLAPTPLLYRLAIASDLVVVAALGVLFVRLARKGMIAE